MTFYRLIWHIWPALCLPAWLSAQGLQDSSAYVRSDHPAQPETHWLQQPIATGDAPLSTYTGTVRLDNTGKAIVKLPNYFDALHGAVVSYQLTPIDRYLQVYVSDRVKANRFAIAAREGLQAGGAEICWTVVAQRDAPAFSTAPTPNAPLKAKPGQYARSDVYRYLDVLNLTETQTDALYALGQEMASAINQSAHFIDFVVVGSYAQGVARGMNTGDPSDLDFMLVLDTTLSTESKFELLQTLPPDFISRLQQVLGLENKLDITIEAQSQVFVDDPATVYYRLSNRQMIGRDGQAPLQIKLVRYGGRWFRFNRPEWLRAEAEHWFDDAELHHTPEGELIYRNRFTHEVLLRSINQVPELELIQD